MNETFANMRDRMETFCMQVDRQVRQLYTAKESEQAEQLSGILDQIVAEYGVYDYSFSYAGAWFAGNHGKHMLTALEIIYYDSYSADFYSEDGSAPNKKRLRGFAAFFLLVTCYIHFKTTEKIQQLLEHELYDCRTFFRDMPLFYDQISRYDKRGSEKSDLNTALFHERQAIDMLDKLSCQNAGVYCSYASTVSIMLERGQKVSRADTERAVSLIEAAIAYNPEYAKYYYIRAKLRFYLRSTLKSDQEKLEVLYHARNECEKSIFRESTQRQDYLLRVGDYKKLLLKIEDAIDKLEDALDGQQAQNHDELNAEMVQTLKKEILNTSSEKDVLRFPPANTYGGKYVFICYRRADYKSVFCDLLELRLRRIPFLYDHGAVLPGYDWNAAVGERIFDPKCVGIIFYLGKSAVLSNALAEEIQLVKQKAQILGKPVNTQLFSINLTGDVPSQMLIKTIQSRTMDELLQSNLNSDRIVSFLSTFTDAGDFVRRSTRPLDSRHIEQVISAIQRKFGICPQEELPK